MSFLLDPPLLYASGRQLARRGAPAEAAVATVAVFLGVSVPLYLHPGRGRWWMLTSGVLPVRWREAGPRTHAAAALLFAAYPLFLLAGLRSGRR
jgi:hypothetical protein